MPKQKHKQQCNKIIATPVNGEIDLIRNIHRDVSSTKTPSYYVSDKGGFDYVDEGYMRSVLNEHYPLWSWEVIKYEFIGDKAISVHGRLTILDHGVTRHFESVAAHRIAVSRKDGNYTDLGNDLKSAVTDCFKVCVNRLCNVADDVYRKQVLSQVQLNDIENLLAEVMETDVRRKVVRGITSKEINSVNLTATLDKLKQIIADSKGDAK